MWAFHMCSQPIQRTAHADPDAYPVTAIESLIEQLLGCRFDHLFGMYKTKEGKARRLDLIFVPPEELGFGTLGWIGGKQFLRFMRAYSDDECGMHLNSHRCGAASWWVLDGVLRCWIPCWGLSAEGLMQRKGVLGHGQMVTGIQCVSAGWWHTRTAVCGWYQMKGRR